MIKRYCTYLFVLLWTLSIADFACAKKYTVTLHVCPNEPFYWDKTDKWYEGVSERTDGVDSYKEGGDTYTLQVEVYKPATHSNSGVIDLVNGTSCSWRYNNTNHTYSQPGIYYDYSYYDATVGGCVKDAYIMSVNGDTSVTLCSGESFYWDRKDKTYTPTKDGEKHTMEYRLPAEIGTGDKTYTITLTFHLLQSTTSTTTAHILEGESFRWFEKDYYDCGTYTDTIPNHLGCDSVGTLNLMVCPATPADSDLYVHVNNFYYWSLNKTRYTESTTETVTVKTACGCDSTVTLHLTINKVEPTDTAVTICTGNSFEWHGRTYTNPGTYKDEGGDILRLGVFPTPTIHVCNTQYIDQGQSATLSVSGADYYRWEPTATLSSEWADEPIAKPTVSTTYTVHGYNAGDANSVTAGDFEKGLDSRNEFYTEMKWATKSAQYGSYIIDTDCRNMPGWSRTTNPGDHTSGSGYYMIADGFDHANGIIWQDTIDVIPGNDYVFSAWFISLYTSVQNKSYSKLQFFVNGEQIGDVVESPHDLNTWRRYYEQWHNDSCTTAVLTIKNQNTDGAGNDFGLDDILFQDLSNCTAEEEVTVVVNRYNEIDSTVYASQLPLEWGEKVITHEGDWTARFYSSTGYNDSVVTMHLHVLQDYDITIHRECTIDIEQRDAGEYPDYTVTYQADGCTETATGRYRNGDLLHIYAVSADDCYIFDHWQDGNTDNPRTVKVGEDAAYTAYFKKKPYTIHASVKDGKMGKLSAVIYRKQE